MAKLVLNTAPATTPVTLAEAKDHLRVDGSAEDVQIMAFINAATNVIQTESNRQLIQATYDQYFDAFPFAGNFELTRLPVQSVDSITYTDTDDATQTVSTDVYLLTAPDNAPGIVSLKANQSWPTGVVNQRDAVKVTYVAGYGTATTDVPESIRTAVLMLVADLYECRTSTSEVALSHNPAARRLIQSELVPHV